VHAARDPIALLDWWQQQQLDVSFLVTSLAVMAIDRKQLPSNLRYLLIGGERFPGGVNALPDGLTLVNNYGPTETTVVATSGVLPVDAEVPHIGRPIHNATAYLLDAHLRPVPLGVAGELYVGGAGVARGYLNRPDLTSERFIDDPFSNRPGARLYKTGDLARYLPDGNLEFLGRNDHQVKIRGFRIELGEIESRLAEHPEIREAAVLALGQDSDLRLVAYVVAEAAAFSGEDTPDENTDPSVASQLKTYLAARLPDYMVPAAFVRLDAFPLTPNGKLDRKALPAPDQDAFVRQDYAAPSGEVETTLAAIWSELLGIERVSRHDSFFALGGHSLLAVKLVERARKRGYHTEVHRLFAQPTLAAFAATLQPLTAGALPEGVVAVRPHGTERPLFLVHESSGVDTYFSRLAQYIDARVPVYGLLANPLSDTTPGTFAELAVRLANLVTTVQPQGPYRVAGWSLGGTLAHALASELATRGHTVGFVGLLDTYTPTLLIPTWAPRLADPARHSAMLIARVREVLGILAMLVDTQGVTDAQAQQIRAQREHLDALDARLPTLAFDALLAACHEYALLPGYFQGLSDDEIFRFIDREITHTQAMIDYDARSGAASFPVHLFSAEQHAELARVDDRPLDHWRGWDADIAAARLRRTIVPGDHQSMMREPHAVTLGRCIDDALFGRNTG
jgi:thioesterase domain-containing protein/aryl carrier-like protein